MDMLGQLAARAVPGASNPGSFTTMPGGASLNTASVATLLGLECSIIGFTGDDPWAGQLANVLDERHINNLLSMKKEQTTGSYLSIVEPDGNLNIAINDLSLNEKMSAEWLLKTHNDIMANSDIWFLNSNLNGDTLKALSNPELPGRPEILAAASISIAKVKNLRPSLANFDILFTNISEANALLGTNNNSDAARCIARFQKMGIAKGSLSQGPDLLWVWDETTVHSFQPPPLETICDVIGAGDALAGTFLAGISQGRPMAQTAPLAICAAQMVMASAGPYNYQINEQELNSRAVYVRQIS